MKTMERQLTEIFEHVFAELGLAIESAEVSRSQRPDIGHFQCNGALREAKKHAKVPHELADQIIQQAMALEVSKKIIDTLSVEGPGFINIRVRSNILRDHVSQMIADPHFGVESVAVPQNITLDYGGLNVAKPMHVGHLRSLMIGESIKRVLALLGHTVLADVHLGDWGTQMGMIITELQREQPDLLYFDENVTSGYPTESPVTLEELDHIYPKASKRCKEDADAMKAALQATLELQAGRPGYRALWEHIVRVSVDQLKKDVARLNVSFDFWHGESFYHEWCVNMLEQLKSVGHATESQGAWVITLPEEVTVDGKVLRELPPLILTKSDGAFLYSTTDLAAIDERVGRQKQDVLGYIVDARQSLHFEQVFRAARKTGIAPESVQLIHADFGTVNGPDGKPFKTRSGETMKLHMLVEMAIDAAEDQMQKVNVGGDYTAVERKNITEIVGMAALKFADLINHRNSSYIFDAEKFTQFEGKTGPYLLYAAVRMQSLLRKAEEQGIRATGRVIDAQEYIVAQDDVHASARAEQVIMNVQLHMAHFPEILSVVARDFTPHLLAEYTYELSQHFHALYDACSILNEENEEIRDGLLGLIAGLHRQLIMALDLLGIDVPEKM